jgi:uncharacterized protein (TIGR02145 family)
MNHFLSASTRMSSVFFMAMIFVITLQNSVLAQSKKEQINALTSERDSLFAVLLQCDQNRKELQESLIKTNVSLGEAQVKIAKLEREASEAAKSIQFLNDSVSACQERYISVRELARSYGDSLMANQLRYQALKVSEAKANEEAKKLSMELQVLSKARSNSAVAQTPNEVQIGTQIWMTKNLDVSKFRNGEVIPEAKSEEEWDKAYASKQPAWCYFNFDSSTGKVNGKLYNWHAVNDKRGLAPAGWHVPSLDEWETMVGFIGAFDENTANKLKSQEGWRDQSGTNETAFNATPAGCYCANGSGGFIYLVGQGELTKWWTSTKSSGVPGAKMIYIETSDYGGVSTRFGINDYGVGLGLSVRCIHD